MIGDLTKAIAEIRGIRKLAIVIALFGLVLLFLSFFEIKDLSKFAIARYSTPYYGVLITGALLLIGAIAIVAWNERSRLTIDSDNSCVKLEPRSVNSKEVDFMCSYLSFIKPNTQLADTYAHILVGHHNRLCTEAERLHNERDWQTLLEVRKRLREYFEWSGQYRDGAEFGKHYVRALEAIGEDWEALWARVKDVAYMLILLGEHDKGRKELKDAMGSPLLSADKSGSAGELLFYCYRYLGISYQRDQRGAGREDARRCFDRAHDQIQSLSGDPQKCLALEARIKRNYGNLAYDNGDYEKAISLYRESLHMFGQIGDEEHTGITHLQIAQAIIDDAGDIGAAHDHLNAVNDIAIRIGWFGGQTASAFQLGRLHRQIAENTKERDRALSHLRESERYLTNCREALRRTDKYIWIGRTDETLEQVVRLRQVLEGKRND